MEPIEAGSAAARSIDRRSALLAILASATPLLSPRNAAAQNALTTPRGTGRPPLARTATLPLARDLASDARTSLAQRKPILLFFDREECPYCERALREYLVPMSRDAWHDRVLFRQVEIDRPLPLVDFGGRASTHERLAEHYGVQLSPTVLVVDAAGRTLSEPIVGLTTVDFYGAYLDRALAEATAKLAR